MSDEGGKDPVSKTRAKRRVAPGVLGHPLPGEPEAGDGSDPKGAEKEPVPLAGAMEGSGAGGDESTSGLPRGMVRSVAILTSSQFVITAGFGIIIPVLPMFAAQLDLGAAGVGAIIAAPSAMRVLLNMPMGRMADRIGRKPLMVAGTIASGIGGFGTGFAGGLASLLPFRALVGAGSAASMAGSSAYMADLPAEVS